MSFAAPAGLLFLLAVPLLVLLEAARRTPLEANVSAASLWRGLLRPAGAGNRRSRFALDWAARARVAAAALAALAAAEPFVAGGTREARVRIVVDRSASMGADAGEGRTRLSLAIERTIAWLASVPESAPVLVEAVPCGEGAVALDAAGARAFLAALDVSDAPLPDAGLVAIAAAAPGTILVSDRVPEAGAPDRTIAHGLPAENAGFVAFEVEPVAGDRVKLWALVRNSGRRATERALTAFGDSSLSLGTLVLAPGEARAVTAEVGVAPAKAVGLRLGGEDALAADDEVRALPGSDRVRAVAEHGTPEPVLRALAAAGGVSIAFPAERGEPSADADLTVGAGAAEGQAFRIRIDPPGGAAFEPASVRATEALASDLDLTGVRIGPVAPTAAASGDRPLLLARAADGVEVAAAVERDGGWRLLFDPAAGNWKDHPSFPVFFAVAVERARAKSARFAFLRTGEALPGGGCVARSGIVEGGRGARIAANLLSAEESSLEGTVTAAPPAPAPVPGEPTPLAAHGFALAAGLVVVSLLLERRR